MKKKPNTKKTDMIISFLFSFVIRLLSTEECKEKKGRTETNAKIDKNNEYSPKSVFDNAIDINLVIINVTTNSIKKLPTTYNNLSLLLLLINFES